jgi:hypothetical protein
VHFLNHWNDPRHPEYNFETNELVYRNGKNNEIGRVSYPPPEERRAEPRLVVVAN